MNDTPPDVQARFDALMASRTGSERVEMMFSMNATARAIVISSIRAAQPNISDADLRACLFERLYASDFSASELAVISARIRNPADPPCEAPTRKTDLVSIESDPIDARLRRSVKR